MKIYTITFLINPKNQPSTVVQTKKAKAIEFFNSTLTTLELFNGQEIIKMRKEIAINNLKFFDKEKNQFIFVEEHDLKI
jgi:hypothetical protein